ncbi:MAG: ATP-dependent Clp protease proteolytic subunit [Lachnospiraceae bacterium]|nr:ATP-dependent Clp protease proteolytic subunit [Lachnospiraceae bacterium]
MGNKNKKKDSVSNKESNLYTVSDCHRGGKNNEDEKYDKTDKTVKSDNPSNEEKSEKLESDDKRDEKIKSYGQVTLEENNRNYRIHLLTIIGEIEGHDVLSSSAKTTKYEHVLPQLAMFEDDDSKDGLLVLIQTCGGDVESGLAISEMIASLSKPTVSLVLGGSHSIGVPIATSTDYSYIVPTGAMVIHPVRMNGLFIGAPQTYDYFKLIQDRIANFVSGHSNISKDRFEELMLNTGILTKDLGTILVGSEAVNEGIINEVGGMKEAVGKLYSLIEKSKKS